MSFDLTVVFTGVLAFVENANHASNAKMCVLIPNADPGRKSSVDGGDLARHRAFVRFPIANVSSLEGGHDQDSLGIWYLDGVRLVIETAEDPDLPAGTNDFHVVRMKVPAGGHPSDPVSTPGTNWSSFTWTLDMQRVCPGFTVDQSLLTAQPDVTRVASQIFLDSGKLSTKTLTNTVWTFDSTLNSRLTDAPYTQVLAEEVMLEYKGLTGARLRAISLDGSTSDQYLDLSNLRHNKKLEIQIVNVCDDNPLEWERVVAPGPDVDTRWVYELLDPNVAQAIKLQLAAAGAQLPIPLPHQNLSKGIGSPGSGNCIPPNAGHASYTSPELDS
jgi:hypothetical protein